MRARYVQFRGAGRVDAIAIAASARVRHGDEKLCLSLLEFPPLRPLCLCGSLKIDCIDT